MGKGGHTNKKVDQKLTTDMIVLWRKWANVTIIEQKGQKITLSSVNKLWT